MMSGGKRQKQQCRSLCFGAARLCLNLHYFVYFVTDYIDGIECCT